MPHPERACEAALGSADGLVLFESVDQRAGRAGAFFAARERLNRHEPHIDSAVLERHGLKPDEYDRIVRALRPRTDADRARHLLGDVVRALQLQELADPPEEAADERPARAAGARRERRRGRHRRRPGRGLQDRVAQPPLVHRALPGRGDRRRRHHPRHLHDGRAADRADELAALRIARRARRRPQPPDRRRRRRRHRRLRQQHRHRRPSAARLPSTTATPAIRWSTCSASASRRPTRWSRATRLGRRQPRLLRRRQDRPRRHPRRDDGVGGVRREVGREAAGRAGRRSVHGEAAARGVPRADADRRAHRRPGHGRGGPDLLDLRDGRARRQPASRSTSAASRSARPA